MTTQLLVEKLSRDVRELKDDIHEMKQFLFAPLKDSEGEYQKTFVKKMFIRFLRSGSLHRFTDKESFLKYVRSAK